jgi:hypothetical protein
MRGLEPDVGRIARYVRWIGHDAGGALRPVDVAAGVLHPGMWPLPRGWAPLGPNEALVYVPPQWIGGWEDGYRLAPGYQHVWRAPLAQLRPLPDPPEHGPYHPAELPPSAVGPATRSLWRRRGGRERERERERER